MLPPRAARPTSWTLRLLSALGFLLLLGVIALAVSGQMAVSEAESYLRSRYHADLEIPVHSIRPDILTAPPETGRPMPPLGFCWAIDLETQGARARVTVDPWTHQVLDWRAEL